MRSRALGAGEWNVALGDDACGLRVLLGRLLRYQGDMVRDRVKAQKVKGQQSIVMYKRTLLQG